MPDALFQRDGDHYLPGPLTEGPWSPDAQHGGPPAALLARAIEQAPSESEMVIARLSIELIRPVPLKPLAVAAEVTRPGRKVQLVSASISHDGQVVATAVGLKIRKGNVQIPSISRSGEPIPGPEEGNPATFFSNAGAYATEAVDIQMIEGDFSQAGPGKAWIRLRVPLLEGEETTPVERVAAAADFGNGVSNLAGDVRSWLFINPDLTIRMARPPQGDWVFLDSESQLHETGTGLATSRLADAAGWLGVAGQSLLVDTFESG